MRHSPERLQLDWVVLQAPQQFLFVGGYRDVHHLRVEQRRYERVLGIRVVAVRRRYLFHPTGGDAFAERRYDVGIDEEHM